MFSKQNLAMSLSLGLAVLSLACSDASDEDEGGAAGTATGGAAGTATGGAAGTATGGAAGTATGGAAGTATGGAAGTATGGAAGTATGGSGGDATGGAPSNMTGGASSGGSATGGSQAGNADPYEQARVDCVARINAFRATEGKPALARWVEQESCTDTQSAADSTSGAHANFGDCSENAQNTCPGWGSIDQVIEGCLQMMWDEGPGEPFSEHGHYLNMSSTNYSKVACGFFEMPNGKIWHNHNFK